MTVLDGITIGGTRALGAATAVGVPHVLGLSRAEAEANLNAVGLRIRVEEVETLGTEGTVYGQVPAPPAKRPKGAVVTLQVTKAPPTPPPDIADRLDKLRELTTKVHDDLSELAEVAAEAEKDEAAEKRKVELAQKLDEIIAKLSDIESKAGPTATGASKSNKKKST
jgi:hypothetical protein